MSKLTQDTRHKATLKTNGGRTIRVSRNHENPGGWEQGLDNIGYISFDRQYDTLTYAKVVELRDAFQAIIDDVSNQKPTVREFLADLPEGAVVEGVKYFDSKVTLEKRADGTWFFKTKHKGANEKLRKNEREQFLDVAQLLTNLDAVAEESGLKYVGRVTTVPVTTYELDFIPA